jgi:Transketolase, C-terminal subunit
MNIDNAKVILTHEVHGESGGLGEKSTSILIQKTINFPFKILGFPDEYMVNGSQNDVLDYYNMSPEKISEIAQKMIN